MCEEKQNEFLLSVLLTFCTFWALIITITRRGTKHTTRPHTPKAGPIPSARISVSGPKRPRGCSPGRGVGAAEGACTPSVSAAGPHPFPGVSVSGPKGSRGCSAEGEDKRRIGGCSGRGTAGDAGSPARGDEGSPQRRSQGVGALQPTEPKRRRVSEGEARPNPPDIVVISRSPAVPLPLPVPLGPPVSLSPFSHTPGPKPLDSLSSPRNGDLGGK